MTDAAAPAPSDARRIRIERRGGLAGLRARYEGDVAALTGAQRAALEAVLRAAPRGGAPPAPGADRFRYTVHVIRADGSERQVELDEDAMPEALQALVTPALP